MTLVELGSQLAGPFRRMLSLSTNFSGPYFFVELFFLVEKVQMCPLQTCAVGGTQMRARTQIRATLYPLILEIIF